jgi:hypothetical protein
MLIPHVVQTEADKVFVNVFNAQTVTVQDGDVLVWDVGTPNGVRTTAVAAGTISLFMGIADGAIAASAYGLAQAYGYKATALVSNDTSIAVVAGDILIPVAAQDYLDRQDSGGAVEVYGVGGTGLVYAAEAIATAAATQVTYKVFIRAL